MTDDEIIEMAKQSGMSLTTTHPMNGYHIHHSELITFARLVAEKQIEIDAALCDATFDVLDCAKAIRSQT